MNIKLEEHDRKILSYLSDHPKTTYKEIANHLNISVKTAGRYVSQLQALLNQHPKIQLNVKPGSGVIFEGDLSELMQLFETDTISQPETVKDREMYVYTKLLSTSNYLRIQDIADELFVSRTTVEKTIKQIREKLALQKVTIISSRQGLKIEASEKKKRHLMSEVIHYYWGGVSASNSKKDVELGIRLMSGSKDLIDQKIMNDIVNVLNKFISQSNLEITEYEYQTLAVHLAIALERIRKKFYIAKSIRLQETTSKYTSLFIQLIEEQFNLQLPDFEKEYIDVHITAIEKNSLNDMKKEKIQVLDYSEQLFEIIMKNLSTLLPDGELINSLIIHLNAAIKRLKLGVTMHNPYADDIKTNFSGSFAISCDLATILEKQFEISMNQEEIAFIALHVQSFLDREGEVKRQVILVCSSGYGTSKLLEQRILKQFGNNIEITQVLGIRDLYKVTLTNELIISTIPINNIANPVIVVSPLMTNRDIDKIECFISKQVNESKQFFMKLTSESYCFISNNKNDTQEIVLKKITGKLLKNGFAEEKIYESALAREQIATTAIENFAMPHAEIKYVKIPTIAIYINKRGIEWDGQIVNVVFFFALNEKVKKSINSIYEFFNELVSNKQLIKDLIQCKTYQQVEIILGSVLNHVEK